MNAARAGSHFERRVKAYLEGEGFFVVRVAGSRGVADLIALHRHEVTRLVQVRRNGKMSRLEHDQLSRTAWYAGGRGWIARRGPSAKRFPIIFELLPDFGEREATA